jgi:MtN3 and saliva related transmembrane protein
MDLIQIIGLVAGLCTSGSILPQVLTTLKKKKAGDVSVLMFIVMLTGNGLWIFYGISKSDLAVIATNVLAFGLNIAMLVLKIKYKDNE